MTDTTQKSIVLESEAFSEASKMSETKQPGMLIGRDSSISVPSAVQVAESVTKINKDSEIHSNVVELSINESSSISIPPQTVASASGIEQQSTEDNPTMPLIFPKPEDVASSTVGVYHRICDSSPSERPPLIECMRCCFTINYHMREEEQEIPLYINFTRKIRNSKYILLVLIALLAIPVSSIYFGVIYKDSCPMAKYSPLLLITMGTAGVIFIFYRLLAISIRRFLRDMKEPPKAIQISLIFMLMILMIIEMVSFYIQKPVFENPRDPAFCEKTFYDYVFYMNFVVLIIGILALLLHIPQKRRGTEQMLPERR